MPKQKTRKSAAKRFKVTGSGKIKYRKQGLRHILTKKSKKRKRHLRKEAVLDRVEYDRVKKLLPYG
jgi:large subunit ribosomal protein L35